jgi:hypothetical protein
LEGHLCFFICSSISSAKIAGRVELWPDGAITTKVGQPITGVSGFLRRP